MNPLRKLMEANSDGIAHKRKSWDDTTSILARAILNFICLESGDLPDDIVQWEEAFRRLVAELRGEFIAGDVENIPSCPQYPDIATEAARAKAWDNCIWELKHAGLAFYVGEEDA